MSTALYPLRGLLYIVQHRVFPLKTIGMQTLGTNAVVSLAFLAALYTKGWSLQAGIISSVLGRGLLSTMAVQALLASEALMALYLLLRRTLASSSTVMFDAVLAHRGVKDVKKFSPAELDEIRAVAATQKQRSNAEVQQWGVLGKLVRFVIRQVGQRLVTAPLLLIPGVGIVAYLWANALDEGTACHQRYFKRKGVADDSLQKAIASSRTSEYMTFGAVAMVFNLVPVVNYVLNFGNAAGAALWAVDMEESGDKWLRPDGAATKQS
jgi:hypothetical protein